MAARIAPLEIVDEVKTLTVQLNRDNDGERLADSFRIHQRDVRNDHAIRTQLSAFKFTAASASLSNKDQNTSGLAGQLLDLHRARRGCFDESFF
ncbi:hypothetical protein NKH86_21720 [Mesorhizobium sp. M0913]|uniref:hypothetical protein n=1 Tax=Mesorhizobium sp. M0913 TaxID=2957026 RepID=UPI003336FA72